MVRAPVFSVALQGTNLEKLYLNCAPVGNAGLMALSAVTTLLELRIDCSEVSCVPCG